MVSLEDEEKPREETENYIIEAAPAKVTASTADATVGASAAVEV